MTHSSTRAGLPVSLALAAVALAACSGTGTSSTAPAVAAPSVAIESPAASASTAAESPSASASAAASTAPSASTGARTVQLYAVDGGFQNPPIDPTPGTVLTFRNVGQEAHEMVVLRRNDDATKKQTFDDLTKVNPADLLKFVTVVGVLAADPGKEAEGQIVLDQVGDYAVVDLLPTGTMTAPASPDPMAIPTGVPNFVKGMFSTFSVVEPEAS